MAKKTLDINLYLSAILTFSLFILFIVTSSLLFFTSKDNYNVISLGNININFNDNVTIFPPSKLKFEPGLKTISTFFVENNSSCDVYFSFFLVNIDGILARELEVYLTSDVFGDLYQGKLSDFTRIDPLVPMGVLPICERHYFTMAIFYPPESGNEGIDTFVTFDIKLEVVQTKNNPDGLFE